MASNDSNGDDKNEKQDNSEDNFGLPDIEYKPLDQTDARGSQSEEVAPQEPASSYSTENTDQPGRYGGDTSDSYDMGETKSKAPMVLGIVIVLVVLLAGYLIYNFVYKPSQVEKAKQEQAARDAAALRKQREEEARLAKQRAEEEERKRQEELAKTPPVGTIETLTAPTKRYYVVVSSDIDDDLLMDYARKLSAKGISTKIIPPFGKKKFYRLCIADHDSFASAQSNADAAKGEYGSAVWVIKY